MNDQLYSKLAEQARAAKIGGTSAADLMNWAEAMTLGATLLELVRMGHLELATFSPQTGPRFRVTAKGARYVEAMPGLKEAVEQGKVVKE